MRSALFASVAGLVLITSAHSQTSPAATSDTKPAQVKNASPWTRGGIDIYLLGDGFADLNFNHPGDRVNRGYDFNEEANAVHLNLAKIAIEKPTGVLGFRLDAGIGTALDQISATDTAVRGLRFLQQFYVSLRPPNMHGLQVDFGKFVTSAGPEVIESNTNWLYSRSLLFSLASPYYHFGVRASMPVTKSFTAGVQVVDGWNSVGTANGFSTVGLTGAYAWSKTTWAATYYFGKQLDGTVLADRKVLDSNVVHRLNSNTSIYLNFVYGSNRRPDATDTSAWYGVSGAGRRQLSKHLAVSARGEWFRDADGYNTGVSQSIKEVTANGEWKWNDHLVSRLEFRRDMSDQPFYDRGTNSMVAANQNTLTLALMAFFGPVK